VIVSPKYGFGKPLLCNIFCTILQFFQGAQWVMPFCLDEEENMHFLHHLDRYGNSENRFLILGKIRIWWYPYHIFQIRVFSLFCIFLTRLTKYGNSDHRFLILGKFCIRWYPFLFSEFAGKFPFLAYFPFMVLLHNFLNFLNFFEFSQPHHAHWRNMEILTADSSSWENSASGGTLFNFRNLPKIFHFGPFPFYSVAPQFSEFF